MNEIKIGIVGGGYMGKAHAVAFSSVGAVFNTKLRPKLWSVAASSYTSAKRYCAAYGFESAAKNWQELVKDPNVDAVVIASPQSHHKDIALAAFENGKHVLCEKPLGASLQDSRDMMKAAHRSGLINMVGFNYIRTPATQYALQLVHSGRIGKLVSFRAEMTEDFFSDPKTPADWRSFGDANGNMGDLAPHIINCARRFMGPVSSLCAMVETVHQKRDDITVSNDDQAQIMLRFESGVMGSIFSSRIATGRKMGYAYHIDGTDGAIRFDGEDQNSLWLYTREENIAEQGFKRILTGPAHPDYLAFCQGPGHGTGYQDQIIIEAKDFLTAIETGQNMWPDFTEGYEVNRIVAATLESSRTRAWIDLNTI